jgi:hypothetical protein
MGIAFFTANSLFAPLQNLLGWFMGPSPAAHHVRHPAQARAATVPAYVRRTDPVGPSAGLHANRRSPPCVCGLCAWCASWTSGCTGACHGGPHGDLRAAWPMSVRRAGPAGRCRKRRRCTAGSLIPACMQGPMPSAAQAAAPSSKSASCPGQRRCGAEWHRPVVTCEKEVGQHPVLHVGLTDCMVRVCVACPTGKVMGLASVPSSAAGRHGLAMPGQGLLDARLEVCQGGLGVVELRGFHA